MINFAGKRGYSKDLYRIFWDFEKFRWYLYCQHNISKCLLSRNTDGALRWPWLRLWWRQQASIQLRQRHQDEPGRARLCALPPPHWRDRHPRHGFLCRRTRVRRKIIFKSYQGEVFDYIYLYSINSIQARQNANTIYNLTNSSIFCLIDLFNLSAHLVFILNKDSLSIQIGVRGQWQLPSPLHCMLYT